MDSFFKNSILDQKPRPTKATFELETPSSVPIAVAISGTEKSTNVVKWALKKFGSDKKFIFKLIHILPKITSVPTPAGSISIFEAPADVAATYRLHVIEETKENLLKPFKKICERKKVAVEVLVLESDNAALAITKEVNQQMITKLFVGKSSHSGVDRSLDVTADISAYVSNLCTVYVVSKGVYILAKEKTSSETDRNESLRDSATERTSSSSCSSGSGLSSDALSNAFKSNSLSLSNKSLQHMPAIYRGASIRSESDETRSMYSDAAEERSKMSSSPDTSHTISWNRRFRDFDERKSTMSSVSSHRDYGSVSQGEDFFKDNQVYLDSEISKLKAELRDAQEMYAMAQIGTMTASRKINELEFDDLALKEHGMKGQAEKETQTLEQMMIREEREATPRREFEKAKEKLEESSLIVSPKLQYQEFSWEDIVTATSSFSEDLKIGTGAYGDVYKCNLHHTVAAVKVLHSAENNLSKQFDQELEILSKISHPHLVLLLGACSERGALVYEYMENGSLDDRLFQVNNSQPIPWFVRFRIAWEVASALVFLHKSKPTPIIHRDLKPGNILLDHNFVSKVGDVGLSTMIQEDLLSTKFTMYKQTSPVGTLCYIDPEYQRTGMISTKSDVYAFGMIILQLLTAQQAMALTYTVEIAMENNDDDELIQILDKKAGNWPMEETRKLAALGLQCTELRSKDRPDLKTEVLPVLESLKKIAEKARNSLSVAPRQAPSHFICPLHKDVMKEPCIAADGYTYDRRSIEKWMEDHRTSPITNSPLQHMSLLPDHTLYAAIVEWGRRNR